MVMMSYVGMFLEKIAEYVTFNVVSPTFNCDIIKKI